jgi:hypothetical protein
LVSEIGTWEAVPLSREEIDEANWNYIDGRLVAKVKEALLICSLSLRSVSCVYVSLNMGKHTQYTARLVCVDAS